MLLQNKNWQFVLLIWLIILSQFIVKRIVICYNITVFTMHLKPICIFKNMILSGLDSGQADLHRRWPHLSHRPRNRRRLYSGWSRERWQLGIQKGLQPTGHWHRLGKYDFSYCECVRAPHLFLSDIQNKYF